MSYQAAFSVSVNVAPSLNIANPLGRCAHPNISPRPARPISRSVFVSCSTPLSSSTPSESEVTRFENGEELIRQFWDYTLQCKYSDSIELFTEDAVYNDLQYAQPKNGKENIIKLMTRMESLLSTDVIFIVDQLVADDKSAAVRWHLERPDGTPIPLTRGSSMYSLVRTSDKGLLISEVWDYTEPTLKLGNFIAFLLPYIAKLSSPFRNQG